MTKLLATARNILMLGAIIAFILFGITGHALAMKTESHETHSGSRHNTNQSSSCVALCTTTTLKNEETVRLKDEENDDDLAPSRNLSPYILNGVYFIPKKISDGYQQGTRALKPPDLVKLFSNFRL